MNLKTRKKEKRLSAIHYLKIVRALKSCKTVGQEITFWGWFNRLKPRMSEEQRQYMRKVRMGKEGV